MTCASLSKMVFGVTMKEPMLEQSKWSHGANLSNSAHGQVCISAGEFSMRKPEPDTKLKLVDFRRFVHHLPCPSQWLSPAARHAGI
jgi:hypothetical protein